MVVKKDEKAAGGGMGGGGSSGASASSNAHFQQHWVWQDREIRFDAPPQQLAARKGQ